MADAVISVVVERVAAIIEEQIRDEVNLVRGVEKEALNLTCELKRIINLLDDAEKRGFKEKSVKDWLRRLENTSYEMDDVLDEWNIALLKLKMERDAAIVPPRQKVGPSILPSCLCFKKVAVRRDIAKKILNVKAQLDEIFKEKDQYSFIITQPTTDPSPKSWRVQSTSSLDLAKVHGRDPEREIIVSKLRSKGGSQEELSLHILAIVGVGGVGKTTLAQLAYNDSRVKEHFELRIWICVSDPFDVVGIAKGIIEGVRKGSCCPDANQLDLLLQNLKDCISGKKFLLVLDDVWTHDYTKWEPLENSLKCGGAGSKILVTTRNERVAKMMGTIESEICRLGHLSDEDCWLVFGQMAFRGRKEEEFDKFQDIGEKIASKCKGLPLAAKVLGSLLQFKSSLEEWENVLNSEIWQLEEAEVELFPHLLLSYNELSPALKRCFSYCAVFPKDHRINVETLIESWMALGYLGSSVSIGSGGDIELKGQEYFQSLAMRSLFQDFEEIDLVGRTISLCKTHDIVHDFAKFLRKDGSSGRVEAATKKATCQSCSPLLISHVNEYRSLFCEDEPPQNLCECLISLRALVLLYQAADAIIQQLGIRSFNLRNIPQGMENLIHLRRLDFSDSDLSGADLKTIFQLFNLQTLHLSGCGLREIPREIGNLIHLIKLNLSWNEFPELPESICDLHELKSLDISRCSSLRELPQGIHKLINLKHLYNIENYTLNPFPQGVAQLTGLRTLQEFRGGSGRSKLGLLKNLNLISGSLRLLVRLTSGSEEVVDDAREAELSRKIHIQELEIEFEVGMEEKQESSLSVDVLDALRPHPNLQELRISSYNGSKLPSWFTSPVNNLRRIEFYAFDRPSSLPALGNLPCLEEINVERMDGLQSVGPEFLGIATAAATRGMDVGSSSSSVVATATKNAIAFPKLKKLKFMGCSKWKEWEDITAKEEESAAVLLMPCLTELSIIGCHALTVLPHRLLLKVSSLEKLSIRGSTQLQQRYRDKDDPAWKVISQINPCLQFEIEDETPFSDLESDLWYEDISDI